MKPKALRRFDLFYLGSLAVQVIAFFVGYDQTREMMAATFAEQGLAVSPGLASGAMIGGLVFGLFISLLLWWLISHRRIEFVKWIVLALLAYSLVMLPQSFALGMTVSAIFALVVCVLQFVAVLNLFDSEAKEWFAQGRE